MDSKLTLKLDRQVIEKAKEYAASHERSLSRVIESYLQSLVMREDSTKLEEIQISPFVKSMASGINIPADIDIRTEYLNFLTEKYK
jgi:hypothetical protein